MNEMIDGVLICLYCGDLMEMPNAKQIKIFGYPKCCEEDMVAMERNKLFKLVKGLDNLKVKIEAEIVKGIC